MGLEGEEPEPCSLVLSCVPSFGTSTAVRKRTWPVCPWKDAVADGQFRKDAVLAVIVGSGNVKTTPALVPIHKRSLQASNAVTRKHAALCCRMIASEPATRRRLKTINYHPDVAKVIARNAHILSLEKPEKRSLCFARMTINKCQISFVARFTVRISLTSIISYHLLTESEVITGKSQTEALMY